MCDARLRSHEARYQADVAALRREMRGYRCVPSPTYPHSSSHSRALGIRRESLGLLGDAGEEEEGEDGETKTAAATEDGDDAHQQQDRRQDVTDAAAALAAVVAEYEGRLAALQREHADAAAALAATHAAELAVARAALTTATASASASTDGGAADEGDGGADAVAAAVAAQRRQYEGQMAALHAQLTAMQQQQHHTTTATSSAALTVGDVAAGLGAGEEGEDRAALRRRLRHAEARAAALTDQIRAMPPSLQVPPIYSYLGPYLFLSRPLSDPRHAALAAGAPSTLHPPASTSKKDNDVQSFLTNPLSPPSSIPLRRALNVGCGIVCVVALCSESRWHRRSDACRRRGCPRRCRRARRGCGSTSTRRRWRSAKQPRCWGSRRRSADACRCGRLTGDTEREIRE